MELSCGKLFRKERKLALLAIFTNSYEQGGMHLWKCYVVYTSNSTSSVQSMSFYSRFSAIRGYSRSKFLGRASGLFFSSYCYSKYKLPGLEKHIKECVSILKCWGGIMLTRVLSIFTLWVQWGDWLHFCLRVWPLFDDLCLSLITR